MGERLYEFVRTVTILALVVIAISCVITAVVYLVTTPCPSVTLCN